MVKDRFCEGQSALFHHHHIEHNVTGNISPSPIPKPLKFNNEEFLCYKHLKPMFSSSQEMKTSCKLHQKYFSLK